LLRTNTLSQGDVSAGKLQQDTESLCTMGGYQDRIIPAPIGDIAMADRHHIQISEASSLQRHNRGQKCTHNRREAPALAMSR